MMSPNLETIRQALEKEIPEIRTGDGIGVLFGFLMSVFFSSLIGIGLYVFVCYHTDADPHLLGVLLAALCSLGLGFLVGRALADSHTIPGADIAESGAQLRHESWNPYNRERGEDMMVFGTVIFFCSFIFGGLYSTVDYLKKRGKVSDDNRSRIAAGIVAFLLEKKAAPQDEIVKSLEQQNIAPAETREILSLLTRHKFVESNPERMWFSPDKRHLF